MTGLHEPLSITTDDDEIVVSVFNVDTYDSARIRLDPDEAEARAHELMETARGLRENAESTSSDTDNGEDDAHGSQMGVPRGAPSTRAFVNDG